MRKHQRRMRRIPNNKPFGQAYRRERRRERRRAEVWAFICSMGICVALTWYALTNLI